MSVISDIFHENVINTLYFSIPWACQYLSELWKSSDNWTGYIYNYIGFEPTFPQFLPYLLPLASLPAFQPLLINSPSHLLYRLKEKPCFHTRESWKHLGLYPWTILSCPLQSAGSRSWVGICRLRNEFVAKGISNTGLVPASKTRFLFFSEVENERFVSLSHCLIYQYLL